MKMLYTPRLKLKGFTLAELLVSLALLGVIATFTIPKILNQSQEAAFISVFKHTLSKLCSVFYEASIKGELNGQTSGSYFIGSFDAAGFLNGKLNFSKNLGGINPNFPSLILPNCPCKPSTICQPWENSWLMHDGSILAVTRSGIGTIFIHTFNGCQCG